MTVSSATPISQLFLRGALDFPDRLVLREPLLGDVDYETAATIVADIVARWRAAGLKTGDRIVVYADTNSPTIYIFLACMTAGIPWVSVSPLFSPAFMRDIFTRVGASWVYTDEAGSRNLRTATPDVKTFGFGTGESYTVGLPLPRRDPGMSYADSVELLSKDNREIAPGVISFFVTTSGSTGRPKLVACKEQPFFMAEQLKKYLLTYECPQYSFLLGSSISHGFALNMTQLALDMHGTMCIPTKGDVATPLEEVRTFDCNVLTMTPRVLRSLYRQAVADDTAGEGRPIFGNGARALLVAGGKPDATILKKVISQKVDPIDHYAASETGVIAVTPPGEWKEGFAGRVIPGVSIEVAPDGELLVYTPLLSGYFDNPELNREVLTPNGHYRTGDLGEVREDGWVRILGRKRDVFGSVEGSAIFPSRIEELIERLPWVEQAIVVGNGEAYISAMIVLRNPEVTSTEEDGFLEPRAFSALYEERRRDLAAINAELERIEWVVRVNLFGKPFDPATYTPVGGAKVRRDRAAFGTMFSARIAELYQPCPEDDPTLVVR